MYLQVCIFRALSDAQASNSQAKFLIDHERRSTSQTEMAIGVVGPTMSIPLTKQYYNPTQNFLQLFYI